MTEKMTREEVLTCAKNMKFYGHDKSHRALLEYAEHLTQPAQAVDVPDAIVSMAVEAWNAAPALGREEDDANAMRAAIEIALSAMSVPALAVTTALAEKVLSAYATICIDRHHDDAPESARVAAMREALTRALGNAQAEGFGATIVEEACRAFYETHGESKWKKLLECWKEKHRSAMRNALATTQATPNAHE